MLIVWVRVLSLQAFRKRQEHTMSKGAVTIRNPAKEGYLEKQSERKLCHP